MRVFIAIALAVIAAIGIGVAVEAGTSSPSAHKSNAWTISTRQPSLRLLVDEPCPKSIAGYQDVTNAEVSSRTSLVPPSPDAGLICRYGTIPTMSTNVPYALVRSKRLERGDAVELAIAIDRVSTKRPTGVSACPAQFAAATVVAFGYAKESTADVWYQDSGCQKLDNGYLASSELGDPAFYNGFVALIDRLAPRN